MMFKGLLLVSFFGVYGRCSPVVIGSTTEVTNSTAFTLALYKTYFNENENTVISPISFRILLSLLYQGSVGKSEAELRDKLCLGEKKETLLSQKISIEKFTVNPNIKIVNKVYLKESLKLNKHFSNAIGNYKSAVEQVDFKQKKATASKINQWVEEQTNHLIKNLITENVLTDDMALLLLNTIYFKAEWKTPFNTKSVYPNTFTGSDGKNYTIDFMSDIDSFKVAKVDDISAQVLELPYKTESNFDFWIILPNIDSTIGKVEEKLSVDLLKSINDKFVERSYNIALPKFEIESLIDGKGLLKKFGVSSIFEHSDINLLETSERLKVDDIKQKTKIIVNTDGTEAATSTYLKAVTLSSRPYFSVNRPFIYIVLTSDTREPVFIGHYSKPN